MTDDPLLALLDAVARHHGCLARATLVVRGPGLPGGAAVYTDDDLREAVVTIGRKAGIRFGDGDRERDRRRAELLRRAAAALRAVERFRGGREKELADGAALALAIGRELAADGPDRG